MWVWRCHHNDFDSMRMSVWEYPDDVFIWHENDDVIDLPFILGTTTMAKIDDAQIWTQWIIRNMSLNDAPRWLLRIEKMRRVDIFPANLWNTNSPAKTSYCPIKKAVVMGITAVTPSSVTWIRSRFLRDLTSYINGISSIAVYNHPKNSSQPFRTSQECESYHHAVRPTGLADQ